MSLLTLELTNFRCIEHAQLELDSGCTVITGENASGKTSILEAISVLSCGHSFRTSRLDLLIKHDSTSFLAVGRADSQGHAIPIGVQGHREKTEARIDGRPAQGFSELASVLPVQVIDPEIHRLLEDGPKERRRFLDWGVFHVEPRFVEAWRRYQRALRQRNAALKAKQPMAVITSWDAELSSAGDLVAEYRERYLVDLRKQIATISSALLGLAVTVDHHKGWTEGKNLAESLSDSWKRDQRYGVTTVGPHRADLVVRVDAVAAKERISRGQQKLLAASLILAQLSHRVMSGGEQACLLLDDPAAELDVDNLKKLLHQVAQTPAQIVVTSLDLRTLDALIVGKRFHVKQGIVSTVL